MKTKEFIKMLQEADPDGEGYVRLPYGGAPYYAVVKEGYWDGPYDYLEKINEDEPLNPDNSIYVSSTKGYKVDICTMEVDDIIWDNDGDMELIKEKIRYDYTYLNDDRQQATWKRIEETAKYASAFHNASVKEWTDKVINKFFDDESKYELRQSLDTPLGYYDVKGYYVYNNFFGRKKEKRANLCQGEMMALFEGGVFYPEKQAEYYVWRYDPEKGGIYKIL